MLHYYGNKKQTNIKKCEKNEENLQNFSKQKTIKQNKKEFLNKRSFKEAGLLHELRRHALRHQQFPITQKKVFS